MMKRKILWIVGLFVVFISILITLMWPSHGLRYLFPDKQFHYQAFRTLGHAPYGGALPGEVMSLIPRINNDESWKREWSAMAERCEAMAEKADDHISKGNALLRASNYYRAAEFFIQPTGEELKSKRDIYRKSVKTFQEALKYLGISHRIYRVPWENGTMLVYYFPGNSNKPVMFINGGYDSTNEESYFFAGAAFIARGYPVVMFEGPGQSSMIMDYNIRFIPQWHKPVGKIIDFIVAKEPGLAGSKKILVGISMGGILVGRAAAFDKRIDGIVLFGSPYDAEDSALFQIPMPVRWLYHQGFSGTFNMLGNLKKKWDRGIRWGVNNGMWTVGGNDPYSFLKAFKAYTLKDVQDKVLCHVFCIYGEKDIYVSDKKQMALFKNSFKNAASYTMKVFREEDGSAEHCQIGSTEQSSQAIVSWLRKYGLDKP
jgi:pimeloyl-ACP methyl ester carboxylesterase